MTDQHQDPQREADLRTVRACLRLTFSEQALADALSAARGAGYDAGIASHAAAVRAAVMAVLGEVGSDLDVVRDDAKTSDNARALLAALEPGGKPAAVPDALTARVREICDQHGYTQKWAETFADRDDHTHRRTSINALLAILQLIDGVGVQDAAR